MLPAPEVGSGASQHPGASALWSLVSPGEPMGPVRTQTLWGGLTERQGETCQPHGHGASEASGIHLRARPAGGRAGLRTRADAGRARTQLHPRSKPALPCLPLLLKSVISVLRPGQERDGQARQGQTQTGNPKGTEPDGLRGEQAHQEPRGGSVSRERF